MSHRYFSSFIPERIAAKKMERKSIWDKTGLTVWLHSLGLVLFMALLPGDFYLQCHCYEQSAGTPVTPSYPQVFAYSANSLPFTPLTTNNLTTMYGRTIRSDNLFTGDPQGIHFSNRRSYRWPFPLGSYRGRLRRQKKPQFAYSHPYRRPHRLRRLIAPSKIQRWKMNLKKRFDMHRRIAERRESEKKSLFGSGRGFTDTFMSSAMMPLSVMAFSMLFMDILGRLMPWSPLAKSTTTTPPPKITRLEYNPPKLPTIGDFLGEVKTQLKSFNDLKGHKKRKKYGWAYDSSEEQYDDDHGPPRRNKNRKKNVSKLRKRKNKPRKKKKKYNSKPLTLQRLQELIVKNRPSFF